MAQHRIRGAAVYVPREYNRVADALSKARDSTQARAWALGAGLTYIDYARWKSQRAQ
jgi:hypothetical protein